MLICNSLDSLVIHCFKNWLTLLQACTNNRTSKLRMTTNLRLREILITGSNHARVSRYQTFTNLYNHAHQPPQSCSFIATECATKNYSPNRPWFENETGSTKRLTTRHFPKPPFCHSKLCRHSMVGSPASPYNRKPLTLSAVTYLPFLVT